MAVNAHGRHAGGPHARRLLLDPRTLAALLVLVAAGCLTLATREPAAGPPLALASFLVAGAAAGYANSGST